MKSITSWADAKRMADEVVARGGKLITTNGCFDILHRGHVSYLTTSRELGDFLIVGINSDASVKKLKGPERPIHPQDDRAYVLAALRFVDAVCVFDEDTPIEWLKTLQPKIHTKGADYKNKTIPETAALAQWGGQVHYIDFVDNFSTSNIITQLKK